MTDKETDQWFDAIFYGSKDKPMMLATHRDEKDIGTTYLPAYRYVVVDPEELERCTFYRSETHDVSLINTGQHMGMCTGNTYVTLGPPHKDGDIKVYEGSGLLCVVGNKIFSSNLSIYDIRHGIFISQHILLHENSEAKKVGDKIREIIDNDRDVTAGQMYRELVTWNGGTSLVFIYNAERDWTLLDFGNLNPESLEELTLTNPGHRKAISIRTGRQEI
jgi:hypothetical protein